MVTSRKRGDGWLTEDAQAVFPGMAEDAERVVAADEDGVVPIGEQAADVPAAHLVRLVDLVRSEQARRVHPVVEQDQLPLLGAVLQRTQHQRGDVRATGSNSPGYPSAKIGPRSHTTDGDGSTIAGQSFGLMPERN